MRFCTPGTFSKVLYDWYFKQGPVHQVLYTRYCTPGYVSKVLCTRYCTQVTVHQVLYTRYYTPGSVHQVLYIRYCTQDTVHQVLYTRYCTTNKLPHLLNYTLNYAILIKYPLNAFKYTITTQKYLLPFISLNFYTTRAYKCNQKKLFITKHRMVEATNLRKPRIFYTTSGCDGLDI